MKVKNLKSSNHSLKLRTSDQIKFIILFVLSIAVFIFVYKNLNNPFISKDPLLKFLFILFKLTLCFLSSSILIYLLAKINFIPKKSAEKSIFPSSFFGKFSKSRLVT